MKHYFSPEGRLTAFPIDGSQDEFIPADFTPATDEQVAEIQSPTPTPATAAEQLVQLDFDNHLTQRNLREFILLTAKAVQELNPAIDLSLIPGIAKVAEVEAMAAALRAQL